MKPGMKTLSALLLTAGLSLPGLAFACGGPGGPGGGPGHGFKKGPNPQMMVRVLETKADELGIEKATIDQIKQLIEGNKAQAESLRADAKAAGKALREAMESDKASKAEVLALAAEADTARAALKQNRLSVMLDIKALLTPDQQSALRAMRAERRGKWKGKKGKRGGWGGPEAEL